ncbi:unnamed protein product [Owenia fusiformis]|uniref:Uncharacterized protein n=1 Tax=Owenia fusiformis TaxID=6347 RepID=A0A8S4PNX7_OWEFU|nr:unnamed protein product [Owenia fusiformis]
MTRRKKPKRNTSLRSAFGLMHRSAVTPIANHASDHDSTPERHTDTDDVPEKQTDTSDNSDCSDKEPNKSQSINDLEQSRSESSSLSSLTDEPTVRVLKKHDQDSVIATIAEEEDTGSLEGDITPTNMPPLQACPVKLRRRSDGDRITPTTPPQRDSLPPPPPPPSNFHSDVYDTVFALQSLGDSGWSDYLHRVRTLWDGHISQRCTSTSASMEGGLNEPTKDFRRNSHYDNVPCTGEMENGVCHESDVVCHDEGESEAEGCGMSALDPPL